jgi:hypothetical protein
MAKADSVYITPPTNTSAIDHPMMFPPRDPTRPVPRRGRRRQHRRRWHPCRCRCDGPERPPGHASGRTEFGLARRNPLLDEAHAQLVKAKVANTAAWDLSERWELDNPAPESKRGKKRSIRKARAYQLSVSPMPWQALMKAESDFDAAQIAVAMVPAGSAADIHAMAACSIIYDEVDLARRNTAPIGRAVAFELVQLGMAALS